MEKQVLYEGEFLKTEYVKEDNYLIHTWSGYPPLETFCKLIDLSIEQMKEKKAKGLILDVRKHKGAGTPSQEYAAKSREKFIKENYPIKQAIILPIDIFSLISVENYSKMYAERTGDNGIKFFKEMDEAVAWMNE